MLSIDGLSNFTKDLALSANGLSSYVKDLALSANGISAYVDKLEISAAGISAATEQNFVHKVGDNIANLTVDNELSVGKNTTIIGNLAVGDKVTINENHDVIALGTNVEGNADHSFTWNADTTAKYSPNDVNTFNINPTGGSKGVYVGTISLSDIIKNDVKVTYDNLSSQLNDVSAFIVENYALSTDVPTKTSLLTNDGDGRGAKFIISSDIAIAYGDETVGSVTHHYIYLKNIDGTVISKFNADVLVKDSFIEKIELKEIDGKTYIVMTVKTTTGETSTL